MKFWYGVERLTEDGHWVASRNPTQELSTLDIPVVHLEKNKCAYGVGQTSYSVWCDFEFPCGICEIPKSTIYYLKGLCDGDMKQLYDYKYYVYGASDSRPYFKFVSIYLSIHNDKNRN